MLQPNNIGARLRELRQKPTPSVKMGRPTKYSKEWAEAFCLEIADGKSLAEICRRDDQPNQDSVYEWLKVHEDFSEMYARAREERADKWAREILEIADDDSEDYITMTRADGSTYRTVDHEHINRSRLRVDTRKWLMARMAPHKYGDRVAHERGDRDGNQPPAAVIVVRSTS